MTSRREFKESPVDRAFRAIEEAKRKNAEALEICETMREFFTAEMWEKFCDAGPDDADGWLAYVQAERENIINNF